MTAVARAAYNGPQVRDVYTPIQLVAEAERVLKDPTRADNLSSDKKTQLYNALLEFATSVEVLDNVALARKVAFIARRIIGEHRSPVSPIDENMWTDMWDTKFETNPVYRQRLREAVQMFYGGIKPVKPRMKKTRVRTFKPKSKRRVT